PAAPSPAAAPAPAPVAAADSAPPHPLLAGREPGVYVVHDHPPGSPCRPVAQTDLDALVTRSRATP
ncbi:MAG: 2-oxoglutarate dehydrogenase, E2 component, dihydrolipoamide succinyltransferase, partial [Deltaproteobacteria bacterium]|nr:2-oxoglutarate dehydrogenase, E2 component, dihydrolipoamide succinyltransferase [Deltaproteobacteria bacterium]